MKIYNVLTTANQEKNSIKEPIFIEEGFSLISFVFQSLWFFYYKLWSFAIGLLILEYVISLLFKNNIIEGITFYGIKLYIAFIVAIFARTWYLESLRKRNYKIEAVIAAKNLDEAKLRFYQLGDVNVR